MASKTGKKRKTAKQKREEAAEQARKAFLRRFNSTQAIDAASFAGLTALYRYGAIDWIFAVMQGMKVAAEIPGAVQKELGEWKPFKYIEDVQQYLMGKGATEEGARSSAGAFIGIPETVADIILSGKEQAEINTLRAKIDILLDLKTQKNAEIEEIRKSINVLRQEQPPVFPTEPPAGFGEHVIPPKSRFD